MEQREALVVTSSISKCYTGSNFEDANRDKVCVRMCVRVFIGVSVYVYA